AADARALPAVRVPEAEGVAEFVCDETRPVLAVEPHLVPRAAADVAARDGREEVDEARVALGGVAGAGRGHAGLDRDVGSVVAGDGSGERLHPRRRLAGQTQAPERAVVEE